MDKRTEYKGIHSQLPPSSLMVPASVYFSYCEILRCFAKFISYFSRLPHRRVPSPYFLHNVPKYPNLTIKVTSSEDVTELSCTSIL